MITLRELDEHVTFGEQLQHEEGPIVLLNEFHVPPEQVATFVKIWADDATFMKQQPGYISAQLHRGTAGSATFLNIAVWESVAALRAAFTNPEFQAAMKRYPDDAVASPHVFTKVAVSNICLGRPEDASHLAPRPT
jgi:quinol monooxygenase YgiN